MTLDTNTKAGSLKWRTSLNLMSGYANRGGNVKSPSALVEHRLKHDYAGVRFPSPPTNT